MNKQAREMYEQQQLTLSWIQDRLRKERNLKQFADANGIGLRTIYNTMAPGANPTHQTMLNLIKALDHELA